MGVEITFNNKTVRFESCRARLPVILKQRQVLVPWGRRDNEEGALPVMPCIAEELLRSGAFQGFKQQLVPIVADSFRINYHGNSLVPDVIQPGQFMQGLMIELHDEKRVYVVGKTFAAAGSLYIMPKLIWKK